MKQICLILLLGLVAATTYAQIPTPPDPSCAYCGVNLKKGEAHKSTCPYYEAPKEEESSSSSLKDYPCVCDRIELIDRSPSNFCQRYEWREKTNCHNSHHQRLLCGAGFGYL